MMYHSFQSHAVEDPVFGGHKLSGIRINQDKSQSMKVRTDCLQTVSLTKGPIDEVKEFTYLEKS